MRIAKAFYCLPDLFVHKYLLHVYNGRSSIEKNRFVMLLDLSHNSPILKFEGMSKLKIQLLRYKMKRKTLIIDDFGNDSSCCISKTVLTVITISYLEPDAQR